MEVYKSLLREYGPQGWWPVGGSYFPKDDSPFEIAAGAVLTQNTTWKNAEAALEGLRKGLLNPDALIEIEFSKLAGIIRSSGYYNQKALRLKEISLYFKKSVERGGTPDRSSLLRVRGIGPETADSILLYAFHIPVFVVDSYTRRIFNRLGMLTGNETYDTIQALFMNELPRDEILYNEYHALMVKHGKEICRKNPICDRCVLRRKTICSYTPTVVH